jgi:hypothetical protein
MFGTCCNHNFHIPWHVSWPLFMCCRLAVLNVCMTVSAGAFEIALDQDKQDELAESLATAMVAHQCSTCGLEGLLAQA